MDLQQESCAMDRAKMLSVAKTHHFSHLHHSHTSADSFTFDHVVCGEDDSRLLSLTHFGEKSPHESRGDRIETCGWLSRRRRGEE
jgi:hypothetical protein